MTETMRIPSFVCVAPLRVPAPREQRTSCMCSARPPQPARVVALGLLCVDLVATVAQYPTPDAKIRTTSFSEYGGGNAANAAVASSRLGAVTALISAVGADTRGSSAIDVLQHDKVDVTHVAANGTTPFTYIIVDATTATRTCIHTPAPDVTAVLNDAGAIAIRNADVLLMDGRHPEVAIRAAHIAKAAHTFVMLDAERMREGLNELLQLTNGLVLKDALADALADEIDVNRDVSNSSSNLVRLLDSGISWVIATRGADGCVLVTRCQIDELLWHDTNHAHVAGIHLHLDRMGDAYIVRCGAMQGTSVVDSTGAGDAFFGAIAYAVARKLSMERALVIASVVAAKSCEINGARGAPYRHQLDDLFTEIEHSESRQTMGA